MTVTAVRVTTGKEGGLVLSSLVPVVSVAPISGILSASVSAHV